MKTFLTILTAVTIAVSVTLLIQRREDKPPPPVASFNQVNSTQCGLDTNGHIVPDGKGGCIPPPSGYIVEVPKPDGTAVTIDMTTFAPICDRAVGASKSGTSIDNDGKEIDRSEYDRRPTHTGEPVPFWCEHVRPVLESRP